MPRKTKTITTVVKNVITISTPSVSRRALRTQNAVVFSVMELTAGNKIHYKEYPTRPMYGSIAMPRQRVADE